MTSMTLRMPDDMGDLLRKAAEEVGLSANQAAVTAIAEWLQRKADERAAEAFAEIAEEHRDLLNRLGTV